MADMVWMDRPASEPTTMTLIQMACGLPTCRHERIVNRPSLAGMRNVLDPCGRVKAPPRVWGVERLLLIGRSAAVIVCAGETYCSCRTAVVCGPAPRDSPRQTKRQRYRLTDLNYRSRTYPNK